MTDHSPRVVVTRRAEQAPALCAKLAEAGLTPIAFPTIQLIALPTDALDAELAVLPSFDWIIFTSVNAVDFFFRAAAAFRDGDGTVRMKRERRSPSRNAVSHLAIAAVGTATAHALARQGFQPDFVPAVFTGAALAAEIGDPAGKRILLPRAKAGGSAIVDDLRARGASVIDIPLYDTVTATPTAAALATLTHGFDAITFASPSSVRGLLKLAATQAPELMHQIHNTVIACIGPVTATAAQEQGLTVTLMPDEYTLDGLVQILADYLR